MLAKKETVAKNENAMISENMVIYENHRKVPTEAIKPIQAGRLKGMSDINPMWRIKALTEEFGPCGIGWYYTVEKQWLEQSGTETVAFVNISLYVKKGEEWSKPIFGTGGSKFVTQERSGSYVSDEAFKMALTDSISVACKQLGIAADVYWKNDTTKYGSATVELTLKPQPSQNTSSAPAKDQSEETSQNSDERYAVTSDNVMSKEQYELLVEEINRTKSMDDVVKYAQTNDLTTISSSKCVALLIGLRKRETK